MTHHATELVQRMRDYWMRPKWLGADIGKTGFFQSDVTGGAAIDDSELRKPYLLQPTVEVAPQRHRVSSRPHQRQIPLLVVAPFTEVILRRRNGQRN
jgi:hypothetical protein